MSNFGPAMQACNERERAFVIAMLETGAKDYRKAAILAGVPSESDGALRVQAHRLAHRPRVLAALKEEADNRLRSGAILGASVLIEIASNELHKDRMKAAVELLNRSGLIVATQHNVTVTDNRTSAELLAAAQSLAGRLGVDITHLTNGPKPRSLPAPVDAEYEVVGSTSGLEDLL